MTTLKRIWNSLDLFDLSILTSFVHSLFDLAD